MPFNEYKDLWVLIETSGGQAASVGLELLNPGAELAHRIGTAGGCRRVRKGQF